MVKKNIKPLAVSANVNAQAPPTSVVFPDLSPKTELECRVLLEDQIIVVDVSLVELCLPSDICVIT